MANKNEPEDFLKFVMVIPYGCWVWGGKINKKTGYGQWKMNYKDYLPHRHSYQFFIGPIQPKMTIDHKCKNRKCVNPDHLEQVTQKENTLRSEGISAVNARKTHCKYGHEFTKENTYIHPKRGYRHCRKCMH